MANVNRLATALIVIIVIVIGGILTLTNHLTYAEYIKDAGIALGLLAVGYGIDAASRP